MRTRLLILSAIILSSAALSRGQVVIQISPPAAQQPGQSNIDPDELVRAVFDPITDDLKLTAEQKFRIFMIASDAMARADVLFDQVDELDDRLTVAAFAGQLDDAQIKQISGLEAALLGQIAALKAQAKINFNKVLNNEQRAMILAMYHNRSENLGALSNIGW